MLAKRIIPCLDVINNQVVKGKRFEDIKTVDDPVELAKFYNEEGADELVFYDITASFENRNIFWNVVEKTAQEVFIPLTVGGGIKTIDDFTIALRAGADKVSVNTAAVSNPSLISEAASKFGSQCVVLSMDIKKVRSDGNWHVFINGGRIDTGIDAIEWAMRGVKLGAGEIVINSINSDGVKGGFDLEITRLISQKVNVPIIASGGAGSMGDFFDAFKYANADGALAASVFHFKELKISILKDFLLKKGIEVRR